MTPDRSKRYAGIDGEIPRLRLATNGQLLLIALLVVALLAMIFPRKQLVEKLYAQQSLDPLTLSYIQNLYQTDAHNADVAILLARAQQDDLQIGTLEAMLHMLPHRARGIFRITGGQCVQDDAMFRMRCRRAAGH